MSDLHDQRMARFREEGLYLVTSQSLSGGRTTPQIVAAALAVGVGLIQLREKEMPNREFRALAAEIRAMTADAGALLIVNDDVDTALEVGADGAHLGLDDAPIAETRGRAPDLILGASTHSVEEACKAQDEGASYINIGPLFETRTKAWGDAFLGLEGLREIAAVARVPFTVMGGIKRHHVPSLLSNGVTTIAVVTAITAADDPGAAARRFLSAMTEAD
jgi:thiamine-phosphate pyrophosphorylase